jgi:hypothetical protein
MTWPQFLKLVVAQRRPAPHCDDHDDAEVPHTEAYFQNLHLAATQPSAARKARRRKTSAKFCEESDRDQGEPERLLKAAEIRRSLQLYTAPEFKRQRRVLITMLAHMSNLSRETVYQARRGSPMSSRVRTVLSRTITLIEKEGLYFRRTGQQWEALENPPPPYTPPAASLQPSPADRKVIPLKIGGLIVNVVHGW